MTKIINLDEVIEIAKKHYNFDKQFDVLKIFDADNVWLASSGWKDKVSYGGNSMIMINKDNGEISSFCLPNQKNFKILGKAKLVKEIRKQ